MRFSCYGIGVNLAAKLILRLVLRRSGWILFFSALISVPAAYYSAKLYGNLKPDIEELLPRKSRSVIDLGEIRSRLLSVQRLAVLVYSDDPAGSKRYVDDLVAKLGNVKDGSIESVEYKIDKELKFFNDRKALFVELGDLKKVRDYIRERIHYETQLYNPLNIFSGVELSEPRIDFRGMQKKYESQSSAFSHFPEGYYASPDGKKRLVLVYLPASRSGIAGVYALKHTVENVVKGMDMRQYPPDLKVRYTGDVEDLIEEHTALLADIETSAEVVFALVTAALVLFFRSFIATGALFTALFMARFWTFGTSWFVVGSLNANSAFMGSIVLGSGITYGVMLLSRYLEERRNGRKPLRAGRIAIMKTARATWTAALAAGFAYGSLFLTQFEGFKQYGIMGLMGMLYCWFASVLVFPALLIQIERFIPLVKGTNKPRPQWIMAPVSRMLDRFPGAILAFFTALTVISLLSFFRFHPDRIIENNLDNLRNKKSITQGSGYLAKEISNIMQGPITPVVSLAYSQETAEKIADRLREIMKQDGKDATMTGVHTLRDFIPKEQDSKIRVLEDIKHALPKNIFYRLASEDQRRVSGFLGPESFKKFGQADLPGMVLQKFTEKDGSIGKLVLVDPPSDAGQWSGQKLNRFVNTIRGVSDQVEGRKVPVAGTLTVTSDMIESILVDGPRATFFAFVGVVMLIFVLFRKPSIALLMLFAMLLGNLWLFGFILGTGFKINFLNFIALPITFGIGVDYGVNIFHRYLHEPNHDILKVVRETGGAVGLCSFTTIIGYMSLVIAQNQAFVSFGILAVLGEVTSLFAAILALPSLLLVVQRRRARLAQVVARPEPA